ncbi:MAG TPA: hypothetical protein VFW15_08775 [Thermoanaerobaculia bacterium]|nr:hypothetical protein [Thermoanaerobaculia bacterium]
MTRTTIDATTQPGYVGRPLIELDGSNAGPSTDGFSAIQANLTIRGFVINRFTRDGIRVVVGSALIQGNYIGTNSDGTIPLPNLRHGILLTDSGSSLIGGPASPPGSFPGNVISGNGQDGVQIYDFSGDNTSSAVVQGNLIGTDAAGAFRLGNSRYGVILAGVRGNLIGGTGAGDANVISANGTGVRIGGLELQGTLFNRIEGNWIGTNAAAADLGNSGPGVLIVPSPSGADTRQNTIGGSAAASNVIRTNGGDGVTVISSRAVLNAIRGNAISSNAGLGIDLDDDGVTQNDPVDADTGPDLLQNFPSLTSASSAGGVTTVHGTLNSEPSTTFVIDFFVNFQCDGSGFGEGDTFLGSTSVTTDGSGNIAFDAPVAGVPVGFAITATATDPDGNTSEFSACILAGGATPTPTPNVVASVPTLSAAGLVSLALLLVTIGLLLARTGRS